MFRRKRKAARVVTEDYEVEYDARNEGWELKYADTHFYYAGNEISLPNVEELNQYIAWITSNKEYIDERISEMWKGAESSVNVSKAHVGLVEIEEPGQIAVMILGDETWGDMGYDLWLRDGVIVNEGAAD